MAVGTHGRDMPPVPPVSPHSGRSIQHGNGPSCHCSRHWSQNWDHPVWLCCGSRKGVVPCSCRDKMSPPPAPGVGVWQPLVLVCAGNPLCPRDTQRGDKVSPRHLREEQRSLPRVFLSPTSPPKPQPMPELPRTATCMTPVHPTAAAAGVPNPTAHPTSHSQPVWSEGLGTGYEHKLQTH